MKVVSINSRRLFGQFYPPAPEKVPEGLKFIGGCALTIFLPTLMFCYETSQYSPFLFIVGQAALGVLLGTVIHNKWSGTISSHFSIYQTPRVRDESKEDAKKVG